MANLAYIQITRDCNQKCRFCSNPPSGWEAMPRAKAKKLIDGYIKQGYEGIILSGGEPTLYSHLVDLIQYCAQKKFPCRIITNGQKTADPKYLATLLKAGLNHINLSIYSHQQKIQNFLSQNKNSFKNIKATLNNIAKAKIRVDINITINRYNSNHLSLVVKFIVRNYPFVKHFVFNNLDPIPNRVRENPDTVPRLSDFELELNKSLQFLDKNGLTFRVERVPLCYLSGFEYCSTETRKIVKNEIRPIYFLDQKGFLVQKEFFHEKPKKCQPCFLDAICAGLYQMDKYYSSKEIYPIFVSKEEIIQKILSG